MRSNILFVAVCATACGEPPLATFTVACADQDCTAARLTADDPGATTVFAWVVDGQVTDSGATFELTGDLTAAQHVQLEATSPGGATSSAMWLVASEALQQQADGTWLPEGQGFEIVSSGDRTVDVECDLNIITTIGGCFTATTPLALHLSSPSAAAAPPSPMGSPNYAAPATFVPAGPPTIASGGWGGARAWSGTGSVEDSWDPLLPSASGVTPRFEAHFTPASATDSHWVVLQLPGATASYHANAVHLDCSGANLSVGSVPIDTRTLDAWAASSR
ncbi:MAG: hypothetical protein KTR31_32270 [Myxococcales bacterium]|nr:hypothetical protein [Myxococcales bacterium]